MVESIGNDKILVTGVTGKLGGTVLTELLKKAEKNKVSVLIRDMTKAEDLKAKGVNAIKGDYTDYSSLLSAFKGIDKLYFVSSSDMINRFGQHQNVVNAAVEAGVKHIIYTSAQHKTEFEDSVIEIGTEVHRQKEHLDAHWKTEKLIKESGINYTILRHGLYADILPLFIGDKVIESGTIFLAADNGKCSYASRNDLGTAGAIILTTEGHQNKVYELGGSISYSFYDIANLLTELSGKTIQYVSPSTKEYAEQLKSFNVPDEKVQGAVFFCQAISQNEFDFPSTDLETILGKEPQSLKEFLKVVYQL